MRSFIARISSAWVPFAVCTASYSCRMLCEEMNDKVYDKVNNKVYNKVYGLIFMLHALWRNERQGVRQGVRPHNHAACSVEKWTTRCTIRCMASYLCRMLCGEMNDKGRHGKEHLQLLSAKHDSSAMIWEGTAKHVYSNLKHVYMLCNTCVSMIA